MLVSILNQTRQYSNKVGEQLNCSNSHRTLYKLTSVWYVLLSKNMHVEMQRNVSALLLSLLR